jgi:hypothetical protein
MTDDIKARIKELQAKFKLNDERAGEFTRIEHEVSERMRLHRERLERSAEYEPPRRKS